MYYYRFRSEYRRRLVRLRDQLDYLLEEEKLGFVSPSNSLMPFLMSVFRYLWCKNVRDLYSRFYVDSDFDYV